MKQPFKMVRANNYFGVEMSTTEIDSKLLEILVCPLTKGPLMYDKENSELLSKEAGLAFPVREGIPIMLVDEARKLEKT